MDRRGFLKASVASAVGAGAALLRRATAHGREVPPEQPPVEGGDAPSFAFCVVADPHCSEGPKAGLDHLGNGVDKFFACMRRMEKLSRDERPDFVLVVGDVHLWELRKHLDTVHIPMHVIAGNHESGGAKREMRDLFPDDFKKRGKEADYYSFVHKGVRFIGVCDAGAGGDHIGQLCSEDFGPRGQCEWLEEELAAPERRKIVFAHIPPEPEGRDRNMYLSRNDSRYFNDLMRGAQPTAMFFGHLHRETTEHMIGRTRSITLRSCCWNSQRAPLGFMVVRATPEGITTREVITGVYK